MGPGGSGRQAGKEGEPVRNPREQRQRRQARGDSTVRSTVWWTRVDHRDELRLLKLDTITNLIKKNVSRSTRIV